MHPPEVCKWVWLSSPHTRKTLFHMWEIVFNEMSAIVLLRKCTYLGQEEPIYLLSKSLNPCKNCMKKYTKGLQYMKNFTSHVEIIIVSQHGFFPNFSFWDVQQICSQMSSYTALYIERPRILPIIASGTFFPTTVCPGGTVSIFSLSMHPYGICRHVNMIGVYMHL